MYMAQKRLRNRERYGFVRYKLVADVEALLKRLREIKFGDMWLKNFIAFDRKNSHNRGIEGNRGPRYGLRAENEWKIKVVNGGTRDERKFVEVVSEERLNMDKKGDNGKNVKEVPKVVAGSSKRDAEQELNQECSKRKKIGEGSEPAEESKDELSQEQLQQLMIIVLEEGINVESLQTKYPIIGREVYTKDSRMYWKIIRVGNHTEVYQIFKDMLKNFDRDDLVKLWSLVHERSNSIEPTEDKEREIWVELKRLFVPDDDDTLWKLQRYMHDPLKWKLYDTCVVHHVSIKRGHDIFMLVEKDYPLTRALMTLMLSNKLQVDEYSVMADEHLRKIFILANKPRQ
ncbi:hypothetical protein Tco_0727022 [Tanacetum coccineum]|uniref:Uncharacterized protein n=1 Tax=Tanacetum coccineum TaxID=301880 RepID=A0ABQ4YIB2_9ASTR